MDRIKFNQLKHYVVNVKKSHLIFVSVLLSSLLIFLCYHAVVQVPFYLDDFSSIVYNPLVKTPVDYQQIWQGNKARFIPYSLFALQNTFFTGNANGFHWVGLVLHIIVSLGVGWLALLLARVSKQPENNYIFITAALLFGLLPQNTQAVIYVVQQAALLVSMFYLLTLCSYCQLRLAPSFNSKLFWGMLGVLGFCGALLSKQNMATLPLAILLVEWLFFKRYTKAIICIYASLLTAGLALWLFIADKNISMVFTSLDQLSRETPLIDRMDYFRSQLHIIFHYLTQFFYPVSLRLEYDWPLVKSWDIITVGLGIFHLSLLILAVALRKKYPLIAFGVLFYYLAHTVESSFIPIKDIVFEHRTYLPNIALTLVVVGIFTLITKKTWGFSGFSIALLVAFFLTADRVDVWRDKSKFYQNEVTLSPKNPRAVAALAGSKMEQGNFPMALAYFDHAMALYKLQPKYGLGVQPETLENYITCLRKLKIFKKADWYENFLLNQVKEPIHRSSILLRRALFLMSQKNLAPAEISLTEAIKLNNKNYAIVINLAIVKLKLNKLTQAERLLHYTLMLKPDDPLANKLLQQLKHYQNNSAQ